MADLKALADAVVKGDQKTAVELTRAALAEGAPVKSILDDGLIGGMDILAALWKRNEVYIPEVLIAARAMKTAMEVLEPELAKAGVEPVGKFLVGTVQGDLHDIGKNLVAMMMKGAGFEVTDAGIDVPAEKFVERAKTSGAQLVGMSALLTTTMPAMEKTLKAMKEAGVGAKIMVGGAPVTQAYADKIGADGYATDAASAVDVAKKLIA
ncbi:MAG: cobalamin B12-binding domain-containing protein [Planctomycetota bacterium]|jgi:5-methyltetrahydrofolate--homocysteine methyltransferase